MPAAGHRRSRPRPCAGRAAPDPHVPGDVRPAPRAQAAHHPRSLPRRPIVDGVRRARQFTDDVEFSAEDATRSDHDFLCRVVEAAIADGATTINLPDTVGYSTPDETREFFAEIIRRVPNSDKAVFSAHCHDDLGLAVANSLAAIPGGVRQVECTINGIGERAGNAALEEIVMAMRVRKDRLPFDTAIQSPLLFETSQLLARLADEPVQANKAIVGRNAFAHEAGIHQDGVLKDARTYEIMRPQDVGQQPEQLVLGRHSGRHAVQRRCDALGLRCHAPAKSNRSTAPSSRSASIARSSATAISAASSNACARKQPARRPLADDANGGQHVEHVGYGHGG